MVDCPTDSTHPSSGQGNNTYSLSPMRNSEVGHFSPPRPKLEIPYQHVWFVYPITCKFTKVIGLIPRVYTLSYSQRKQKTTPTRVVVSSVEEAIFATLEELVEAVEK